MARLRQQLLTWQGLYIPLRKSRKIAPLNNNREALEACYKTEDKAALRKITVCHIVEITTCHTDSLYLGEGDMGAVLSKTTGERILLACYICTGVVRRILIPVADITQYGAKALLLAAMRWRGGAPDVSVSRRIRHAARSFVLPYATLLFAGSGEAGRDDKVGDTAR